MAALENELPRIKVPVGEVAIAAYQTVFGRLGLVLDLGWLPLLILLAARLGPGLLAAYFWPGGLVDPDGIGIADIVEAVAGLLCLNAFAVRWHQIMLLPRSQAVPRRLFVGAWLRFLAYTALFYGVARGLVMAAILSGVGVRTADIASASLGLAAAGLGIAASLAMARSALVFPAAAYGRPVGLPAAWRLLRGNTWRLVGAIFLVLVPVIMIIGFILSRLLAAAHIGGSGLAASPPLGLFLLGGVLDVVLNFLFAALVASILANFYRRIVLRRAS